MFAVGDIVKIFAPTVGYKKYHLCIMVAVEDGAHRFLFLNSDGNYKDCHSVECSRVPCLPPSDTGVTAFSFSMVPRYTDKQLRAYEAERLGELDPALAAELLETARSVRSLAQRDLATVIEALEKIAGIG